jgi:hypothetical protein
VAPANVTGLSAIPGNGTVRLNWVNPSDADFAYVEITWTPDGSTPRKVYLGEPRTYLADDLTNGTPYSFTVKTVDLSGNKSTGATATATPDSSITDDHIAPTLVSAIVQNAAPNRLVLTFSEEVAASNVDGWTLQGATISGTPAGLGTATWTVPLSAPVSGGAALTISYNASVGNTRDHAGNPLANFTSPVTNNVSDGPVDGGAGVPRTFTGTIYEKNIFGYTPKTQSGTLTAGIAGGSGTSTPIGTAQITSGSFTITLQAPNSNQLSPISEITALNSTWNNVRPSNNSARYGNITFNTSGAIGNGRLERTKTETNSSSSGSGYTTTQTTRLVSYCYVDRDVTITGDETTATESGMDITYEAFSLNLQAGWNALYYNVLVIQIASYTPPVGVSTAMYTTFSVKDPDDLDWVWSTATATP